MFEKSIIGPALMAFALFSAIPAYAAEDPTVHQVYEAAQAGRFDDAQAMMDKVLRDHPNSAKAHYIEAELLAKQARLHDAQTELNTAERLDPGLTFANRQKIQELQNRLSGSHPVVQQRVQPAYANHVAPYSKANNEGSGWVTPMIIIGLIVLFFVIVRMFTQRNNTVVYGGGSPGFTGGGYGPGAPSYGPGVMGGGPTGGGIGSGIIGGLATGAAMGAGIVAGEELMHHFTDGDRKEIIREPAPDNSTWNAPPPDDMGGNDFGVSDNSSWDSGGGGGGSDDW
jgi:hypothetical protein